MKSKTTTGFCALAGGGLGLQYFYLGRISSAICCLLFCWTFVPAMWGFVQGCQILSMSEDEFQNKYVRGEK